MQSIIILLYFLIPFKEWMQVDIWPIKMPESLPHLADSLDYWRGRDGG